MFFNRNDKPFYLIYIGQNENTKTIEHIINEYALRINDNIKIDTSGIYPAFNPYSIENPRLVLVNNNKIVHDTVYLPDNLEKIIFTLIDYYGFETK
ncbi:MAG: hypothetical protein Kow0068_02680 [Marinilabiliales bacterium]